MSEASPLNVPPICVIIGRTRHKMVQAEIGAAVERGAKLIELRLDYLRRQPDFKRLLEKRECQFMATVRRPADGGRWHGSEVMRQTLLRQAIVAGFDWVDLETDIIDDVPRFGKVKRLVSYHNMREVPDGLEETHEKMCAQDADIVKIAVRAQNPSDNLRVLRLCQNAAKPTIAIAMGDIGVPSRILGAKFGAPFTYAAFNQERTLAPGLLNFNEMRKVYDYARINTETKVYGVIGDPIAHSLSPLIHNRAFRELGINAVYVPFRAPRGELEKHCKEFDFVPVEGYSVTIPHKEPAARLASEKDDAVLETEAANTLVRRADGTFSAHNTDYLGALAALRAGMGKAHGEADVNFASRNVLILGAGGVARAIAFALKRERALLTVAGRTGQRAAQLADDVKCRVVDWGARHSAKCDVVINCTPVGMHPNVDESPLHASYLQPGVVVFDTVYVPEATLLIKEARNRGCTCVTGVDFFVRQAAKQFEIFTGKAAPEELMQRVVRRALSPLRSSDDEDEKA